MCVTQLLLHCTQLYATVRGAVLPDMELYRPGAVPPDLNFSIFSNFKPAPSNLLRYVNRLYMYISIHK